MSAIEKIRLHNITCDNDFSVYYSSQSYKGPFIYDDTYPVGTTTVVLDDVDPSTQYFVKIIDEVTKQYVIKTIHINDNECFQCI